jgi:glycine/D-amino acid oxidase-like deaminating enzyme
LSSSLSVADLARGRVPPDGGIAFKPYWWEAAPPKSGAADLPAETDVAVVGSGFTGLSAALTLLRRGRSCVVLERDVPGYGASTRNGGQIGTGNQKFNVAELSSEQGGGKALELLREGTRILDYIEHVITTENIDCHYRRCGRFRGAMRPNHYDRLARTMDDLKTAIGLESFMVPRAEQHQEVGSDIFFGGTVVVNDASLHPGLYHMGLMDRVKAAGGTIVGNAGVTSIAGSGSAFRLMTAAGEIKSHDVIVATDGHTDKLIPQLRPRIVPVLSSLIVTGEIPEPLLSELLPKNRVYGNTNRVFSYFRTAPSDQRIIWGGRGARFRADNSATSYSHLARDMLSRTQRCFRHPCLGRFDRANVRRRSAYRTDGRRVALRARVLRQRRRLACYLLRAQSCAEGSWRSPRRNGVRRSDVSKFSGATDCNPYGPGCRGLDEPTRPFQFLKSGFAPSAPPSSAGHEARITRSGRAQRALNGKGRNTAGSALSLLPYVTTCALRRSTWQREEPI